MRREKMLRGTALAVTRAADSRDPVRLAASVLAGAGGAGQHACLADRNRERREPKKNFGVVRTSQVDG